MAASSPVLPPSTDTSCCAAIGSTLRPRFSNSPSTKLSWASGFFKSGTSSLRAPAFTSWSMILRPLTPPSCWQITTLEPFGSLAACLVYVTKASASFSSAFCRLTSLTTATLESNDGLTASSKAYWSADVASSSMSSASGRAFNACAHSALVRASFKYESPPGTTVTGTFAAVFVMPPSRHTGWTMTCRHNGPAAPRD